MGQNWTGAHLARGAGRGEAEVDGSLKGRSSVECRRGGVRSDFFGDELELFIPVKD